MDVLVPKSSVPVLHETDVVVCGGGCAGVTAAIAAARHGASVILLERWPSVGGMATNALVTCWHRSDRQKMVIYGLVEESTQRALPRGWIWQVPQYPRTHETHWFDPEGMRIVWHAMLDEANVRTLCYTVAGDPLVENGRIRAVLCDTKRGRRAVVGKIFIDATGDGDLAAKTGAPFDFGRPSDGRVQGMTLIFNLKGIDLEAVRRAGPQAAETVTQHMRELRDQGRFPQFNEGAARCLLEYADNDTLWNMLPVAGDPLDEQELSRLNALAHEQLVAYLDLWRKEMPGYANARIAQSGFALGVRESRRVRGLKTLTGEMVLGAVKHPDAIGHGVWMVDIHDPKGTGYTTYSDQGPGNQIPVGRSYHIPLAMCLNPSFANLAVVGRCASSTHEAHASVRVQTHCMVMGQGVGTCAAMALDRNIDMLHMDAAALQTQLKHDGVYIEDIPQAG